MTPFNGRRKTKAARATPGAIASAPNDLNQTRDHRAPSVTASATRHMGLPIARHAFAVALADATSILVTCLLPYSDSTNTNTLKINRSVADGRCTEALG
jgi:hypothetical protein